MAKVLLFTFYDYKCVGMRLISKYLDVNGHKTTLVMLKHHEPEVLYDHIHRTPTMQTLNSSELCTYNIVSDPCSGKEFELLLDKIKEVLPDIIGFSARSFMDDQVHDIMTEVRRACPEALLIAGGYGPSFSPEVYLADCDFITIGDGEDATLAIAEAVDRNDRDAIKDIPNVAYVENGKVVTNPIHRLKHPMDHYPVQKYNDDGIFHIKNDEIIKGEEDGFGYHLLASRGCLASCTYCSSGSWKLLYEDKGRDSWRRGLDHVFLELNNAKSLGYGCMVFHDSYLVYPNNVLKEFLERYIEEINLPFRAMFHPVQMVQNPDLFDLACKAKLSYFGMGIQSGNWDFARDCYKRFVSHDYTLEFSKMCQERKLKVYYEFIGGNPLETEEDKRKSYEYIAQLPFDVSLNKIITYQLTLFPGTPLADMIRDEGKEMPSCKSYYYEALMNTARAFYGDDEFERIYASEDYKKTPSELHSLLRAREEELMVQAQAEPIARNKNASQATADAATAHVKDGRVGLWGKVKQALHLG